MMPGVVATFALAIALYVSLIDAQLVVQTDEGRVSGTILRTRNNRSFLAFTAIPYAEPPLGNLRFRNPAPKNPWNGTFAADKPGNQCLQRNDAGEIVGNEDCLQLNVYTPRLPQKHGIFLPVMVYIHGGGYINGNGSVDLHDPRYLLDRDVVLVTMNYRLGIFGFLSAGNVAAPGNYGLKDQLQALKWTQRNIRSFGGDPSKVTLFGQSAGGASVNLHALSDRSDGLFHQYIIQSGVSIAPMALRLDPDRKNYARKLALRYACPTNDSFSMIDCIRLLDVDRLMDTDFLFEESRTIASRTWGPTIEPESEDAFITDSPVNLIKRRKMKDLRFMSGVVRDEGLFMTAALYTNASMYELFSRNLEMVIKSFLMEYWILPDDKLIKAMKDFYIGEEVSENRTVTIQGFTKFITDAIYVYPEVAMIKYLLSHWKSPFYFYSFEYRGTMSETSAILNNSNIGVSHADELIYLFSLKSEKFGLPNDVTLSKVDNEVVDIMVDLWTSFAITGVPTSSRVTANNTWKPYSNNYSNLRIGYNSDPTPILQNSFFEERMNFWDKNMWEHIFGNGTSQ